MPEEPNAAQSLELTSSQLIWRTGISVFAANVGLKDARRRANACHDVLAFAGGEVDRLFGWSDVCRYTTSQLFFALTSQMHDVLIAVAAIRRALRHVEARRHVELVGRADRSLRHDRTHAEREKDEA